MALDVYTWLAQRLHRVSPAKPAFVPWVSLWEQFGQGYERIRDFRRVFRWTLVDDVTGAMRGRRRPPRFDSALRANISRSLSPAGVPRSASVYGTSLYPWLGR
jgi:hypothetical protein